MNENLSKENGGNATGGLAKILNQLNLPTLGMIMLMGGGNFFATKTSSEESRSDTLRAVREIHDLHAALDDFEERQKQILNNQARMLEKLKQNGQ